MSCPRESLPVSLGTKCEIIRDSKGWERLGGLESNLDSAILGKSLQEAAQRSLASENTRDPAASNPNSAR